MGVRLLSTGGTAKALAAAGLPVTEVGDYTGFPEMLDGRVKTLHPRVHAGILARRDVPAHVATMVEHDIPYIDLVVVNLYPFRATVAKADCTLEVAIENIDIGGPAMVRSAAKNYKHVGVVVDPADYPATLAELQASGGTLSDATRFGLAQKAFSHTASYDGAISNYLTAREPDGTAQQFPGQFNVTMRKLQDLRYGENPHQSGAFYREEFPASGTLATYRQIQGKELSYNNIADADAAWECAKSFFGFDQPFACVIVKHANPCGVALSYSATGAYQRAYATDPTSAFGGIIAFNRTVDAEAAEAVSKHFLEVLIAPGFTDEALAVLASKPDVRVLEIPLPGGNRENVWDAKRVGGGLLVQSPDVLILAPAGSTVATTKTPDAEQLTDLLFAWRVAKYVKSNAIVFARSLQLLGVGAGQMSRLDSAHIASIKAKQAGLSLVGSVAASDAFFPFRDGLDAVVAAGAVAVIQPGGSKKDEEVIAAAEEHGIAMVFTGMRHFRH
jgi:phosphoribosylaminoimidazolecarboxamide formyltransferase/IMP cyclohydrolase